MTSSYIYELRSINFWTLSAEEQTSVRRRFTNFLMSLTEPIAFRIVGDVREVDIGGDIYDIPYKRFFVLSAVPIDPSISYLGTKFVRVPSIPDLEVKSNLPLMMVDSELNFVQAFNVSNLSGALYIGFLNELYGIAQEVRVDLEPVEPYEAGRIARGHYLSVGTRILMRQHEGRAPVEQEDLEYRRTKLASELVAAGREKLFRLRFNVVLRDKTIEGLRERRKRLGQILTGLLGCEIDHPRFMQRPLFTGKGPEWATGRRFYVTGATAMTFFPFAGLDIIDPMGVMIGRNKQTGNAVIYDIYDKANYNMAIMGSTGSGKSTLVKSVMSRLVFQNDDMLLYLFDAVAKPEYSTGPDGTYENSFAGITKSVVHHYRRDEGAGLDPYAVFPEKRMASDFIASLIKLEEDPLHYSELYTDLVILGDNVRSVDELIEKADGDLKNRLVANLKPYLFLFSGKMEIYDRMVFVLYDIPDRKTKDAAAFLTLSAVWKKIREMPTARKKAIVVDEGWAFMEKDPTTGKMYFPLAVEYIPEIARMGRHYNTVFLVATQLVSDFFGIGENAGPGRAMVESCATKFLLRQEQKSAADTLKEKFALSDDERDFIMNADVGNGIMITNEGRVPFHNDLGTLEKRVFTTAPKEVTA